MSNLLSRLKELLEQYKLEIPDPEFADDNVIERETRRIRVRIDARQFLKCLNILFSGKMDQFLGRRTG